MYSRAMALNPQQERVAELIASGCTPSQVAGATGFSLGYISQLGKIDDFNNLVVELAGERVEAELDRQDSFDDLEGSIVKQIKAGLGTAEFSELTRALDVVAKNNPKRTGRAERSEGADVAVAVTVLLPQHVLQPMEIKTDSRNRVIDIGGQSMIPLKQAAITQKIKEYRA